MWWADTTTGVLKQRNAANSAWVIIGTLASTNLGLLSLAGGTLTGAMLADDAGTAALPAIAFDGDTNTGIFRAGADQFNIATNGVERVEFGNTEVVFNDDGADVDFRVEGDTNPNLFKIDAGLDEVQVANLNGGQLAGLRNAIINGNFDFWQRGTSFTGSEYGADRWVHNRSGTTHTATRQPFTVGQTAVPNEPTYFCRTVVSSVAGAGNFANLVQKIEDVRAFAGQQVTVSFWAKVDATKNIAIELVQDFGTGGSPSAGVTTIGTTKVSIGTSWQKVTVTATVPSISGKTLGANSDHSLTLVIWFDAGSTYNARTDSLGQQSGTFEIAQVQVERGPVATPFERRSIGQELALCQRYYQLVSAFIGGANAASVAAVQAVFQTPMRATPTLGQTGVIQISDSSSDFTQSAPSLSNLGSTPNSAVLFLNNFSSMTVARVAFGPRNGPTTNTITLSSEL